MPTVSSLQATKFAAKTQILHSSKYSASCASNLPWNELFYTNNSRHHFLHYQNKTQKKITRKYFSLEGIKGRRLNSAYEANEKILIALLLMSRTFYVFLEGFPRRSRDEHVMSFKSLQHNQLFLLDVKYFAKWEILRRTLLRSTLCTDFRDDVVVYIKKSFGDGRECSLRVHFSYRAHIKIVNHVI